MAGVGTEKNQHTEDWQSLPWKKIQRNVRRLQQRIYRAERRGDHTNSTAKGAYGKGPRTEEPDDVTLSRPVL